MERFSLEIFLHEFDASASARLHFICRDIKRFGVDKHIVAACIENKEIIPILFHNIDSLHFLHPVIILLVQSHSPTSYFSTEYIRGFKDANKVF
ncbi:hypothetical protein DMJ13_17315 [halophilic archaeon]|nr:hypothetical protein DMJ13_17315 [halophilic archaeon]